VITFQSVQNITLYSSLENEQTDQG